MKTDKSIEDAITAEEALIGSAKKLAEAIEATQYWRKVALRNQINKAFSYETALLEQVAWYYRAELTGYTITHREADWLLVLRIKLKNGQQRVTFTTAASYHQLIRNVMYDLTHKALTLKQDKYQRK